jgi:hypothetical protein
LSDSFQFPRHMLVGSGNLIEGIGDFACEPGPRSREPRGEISVAHRPQTCQYKAQICVGGPFEDGDAGSAAAFRDRFWLAVFRLFSSRWISFHLHSCWDCGIPGKCEPGTLKWLGIIEWQASGISISASLIAGLYPAGR